MTGVCGVRVGVCVHAWAGSGRCTRALLYHRLFSVVHTTHITSITFVSSMTFFIFFTTTSTTPTTATATSPSNQLILEHFGGVDANSLCNLLNNNLDNDHVSDEPDILQLSSYYDDDSLNNLFTDKADSFSILSLNCQSLNAKFEQINFKIQQLQSKGHEFIAICLQETWLSDDSDI